MPTVALVAAGTRLGLSLGRVFGSHGFDVALIARSEERLAELVEKLAVEGVQAAGFAADVLDRSALVTALDSAAARFGRIDVLHYSAPYVRVGEGGMTGVLDVTAENLRPQIESSCYGAITATRAVLPAMLAAGAGTVLYTTGASAVTPTAWAGSAGAAGAALRNWALNLHGALGDKGIYVGYVALGAWIVGTPGTPADASPMEPDDIARRHWDMYVTGNPAEILITS
ncbi:SDR family NAD(P)-dependent oxidoreductase [Nocardia sp. alder85J]|uniref:SDR family NAD(P)-dependent oxidoreductase n=1 Tax=Nocardia sp. alder85J TaxID=2862949 RepID=UPI001CD32117|nr:SDR family NAD(P)-dependent oxidoreductase [Nocardia sp. alder85J]MCX4095808.1 SDR family NAD(P)-dependent oxidoreductase [Nocardia sp. alder85J]